MESYAKVLRFEKPTGFAGRRFRAFQCPKIIPLYPALKSTAWISLQKPTQKLSIFVSKIIKFLNQSLSYSLPINSKARCIKSCWPCIDCAYETLLPNYSREYFAEWKPKRKTPFKKTPSTIRRKISVLFGCFSIFFTPCLHLISP